MSKTEILTNTIKKLNRLDERSLKEASDFVDFLLYKLSDRNLIQEIQKQAETGSSFSFLQEEEELYSTDDLKERYNEEG